MLTEYDRRIEKSKDVNLCYIFFSYYFLTYVFTLTFFLSCCHFIKSVTTRVTSLLHQRYIVYVIGTQVVKKREVLSCRPKLMFSFADRCHTSSYLYRPAGDEVCALMGLALMPAGL